MAHRLATEYVKTCLQLTEAQMFSFIQMFVDQQVTLQVKVLENGNQEIVFQDDEGQEIVLSFEQKSGNYVCMGSCRLSNTRLANLMRKAVSEFKGSAIVNRIYTTYTMIYFYELGSVVKIVEAKGPIENIIYEYKDTLGQMEQLFLKKEVEREIEGVHDQINRLLDLRNLLHDVDIRSQIDGRLSKLTQRLFMLEA
jgi:hypothetical protein